MVDNKAYFKNIPYNLPTTAFSCQVIGSRGSGKSQLIKKLMDIYSPQIEKINRYLISPTAFLDNTLSTYFDHDHVFTDYDDKVITFIEDVIKANMEKDKLVIYEKTLRDLEITQDDFNFMDDKDKRMVMRKYKNNLKKYYRPDHNILIVEDSLGTFKAKSKLSYLFTRHRWYNLSIIISSQSFRSIPVVIRNNCVLNFIFQTNNKELKKIEEEFDNFKDSKNFENMFRKYAVDYNTLFINRGLPKNSQYSQNLDRRIKMTEFEQ
jgi:hypothetical protein